MCGIIQTCYTRVITHMAVSNKLVTQMMEDKRNMVEPAETLAIEPRECWIPNKMFIGLYVTGILGLIALSLSGMLDGSASSGLLTLTIVYGLLGSLMFFKKISIVSCPSRILLGAAAFIGVTAFIDKYYI